MYSQIRVALSMDLATAAWIITRAKHFALMRFQCRSSGNGAIKFLIIEWSPSNRTKTIASRITLNSETKTRIFMAL